jgi:hypothetical protein
MSKKQRVMLANDGRYYPQFRSMWIWWYYIIPHLPPDRDKVWRATEEDAIDYLNMQHQKRIALKPKYWITWNPPK